ncbi:hypothetical protein [Blastococcus sp. URHD0036]|uniref:hypothetical protein n=1 Tax=Blastococcus sp. URHD0036 TaxID=1380356 RepID=UPI000495012D|nr:hypothetical protein [Blastococcus sp. URHD0036]
MSASDRVTWTACPRCGGRAAVGWSPEVAGEAVVEFDCTGGCPVPLDLARAHLRRPPGPAGPR